MQQKTIIIGGRTFRIDRKAIGHTFTGAYTIIDAYRRPSCTKIDIWNNWVRWALNTDARICVESANSQTFTISGDVECDGVTYYLYITPTYRRVYPR